MTERREKEWLVALDDGVPSFVYACGVNMPVLTADRERQIRAEERASVMREMADSTATASGMDRVVAVARADRDAEWLRWIEEEVAAVGVERVRVAVKTQMPIPTKSLAIDALDRLRARVEQGGEVAMDCPICRVNHEEADAIEARIRASLKNPSTTGKAIGADRGWKGGRVSEREPCEKNGLREHCGCWWDDEACCWCGAEGGSGPTGGICEENEDLEEEGDE